MKTMLTISVLAATITATGCLTFRKYQSYNETGEKTAHVSSLSIFNNTGVQDVDVTVTRPDGVQKTIKIKGIQSSPETAAIKAAAEGVAVGLAGAIVPGVSPTRPVASGPQEGSGED